MIYENICLKIIIYKSKVIWNKPLFNTLILKYFYNKRNF